MEIDEAVEFTERYGIKHEIIELRFPEIIRYNPNRQVLSLQKDPVY